MNRFRSRKKAAKEAADKTDTPPVPAIPALPAFSFKKGKKNEPEAKPEVDLSTALPSSDDFRTSLLMPNLSARFSMLREQDDPTSKLGKANDDSVLFPKRASRLNLFNHAQLNDIAEVTSLAGSSRPSLAIGRSSFTSGEGGYATDDDFSPSASIMSRSRPVDGNNLFGGRQKIYKIPVTETQDDSGSTDSGSRSRGRPLYENDVTLSAFQKMKREELRQKLEAEGAMEDGKQEPTVPEIAPPRHASPPPSNRISNSTGSINSRNRSAERGGQGATNNSQPSSGRQTPIGGVERSQTKSRRLYEQGLERHQPSSALNRLESLSRQRAMPSDSTQLDRSLSKSAVSLNEQFQKPSPVYASSTFRPTSPPVSASSSINVSAAADSGKRINPVTSPSYSQTHGMVSPLSPPLSESSETSAFIAAVHPDDRGKATACGLFNKPASKYDDNQFSQLQLQIHEGRGTPPPRRSPSQTPSENPSRSRAFSNASHQSKMESPVLPLNIQHGGRRTDNPISPIASGKAEPVQPPAGMFTGMFNSSDNESDGEGDAFKSKTSSISQAYDGIPPSLRTSMESRDSSHSASSALKPLQPPPLESRYSESRDLNTIDENVPAESESAATTVDEPVEKESDPHPMPPPPFGGLSGLIRTHLRQDSDRSSILPPPSPVFPPASGNYRQVNPSVQEARDSSHADSIHSNPWEYDEWSKQSQTLRTESRPPSQSGQPAEPPQQTPQPPSKPPQPAQPDISSMSLRAKQILGQAAALSSQKQEEAGRLAKTVAEEESHEPEEVVPPREEDTKLGHHRGGSSETQMDREEFANELAERRRKVQEKLRSLAENESRSNSPTPGQQRFPDSPGKPGNAFAMLKSKASRNTAYTKQDFPHSKPPHRPSMDRAGPSSSSPNLQSADAWREEEENMIRDMGRKPRSESPSVHGRHPNMVRSQYIPPPPRRSDDDVRNTLADGSSSPSLRNQSRDRSGSDTSGRSKSRPRYRDDLESVRENTEQPQNPPYPDSRSRAPSSVPSSTRPSFEVTDLPPRDRSGSVTGGRFRSNSRAAPPHLDFNNKQQPLIQPGPFPGMNNSPRPSPVTPYSANTTPPLYETSPATSAATTPTFAGTALSSQGYQQRGQGSLGQHRRVVDKYQISEPKLVSSTSNVPTVGLPPGASLSNGTPPIPPMNPRRRRQTTTQTILGAFKGSEKFDPSSSSTGTPRHSGDGEHSTFSDDEDKRPKPRQRLRKISSEGGNLNAKARQQIMSASNSTPALPQYPKHIPPAMDGGMI